MKESVVPKKNPDNGARFQRLLKELGAEKQMTGTEIHMQQSLSEQLQILCLACGGRNK